jgi:membrane-associated phospholipid phosphatase
MNLVEYTGYHGPHITSIINLVALYDQKKYWGAFILFYLVNYRIVGVMKNWIKEPRPTGYLDVKYRDGGDYTEGAMTYGMPSGHSAIIWYSTVYLWLVKQSPYLLIIELVLAANTMYQRWVFRKHTIGQLVAGALVGGGVAWIAVIVTKRAVRY